MADEQDLSAVESIEVPSPESLVILPIPQAIKELAPNTRWSMTGYDVSRIVFKLNDKNLSGNISIDVTKEL